VASSKVMTMASNSISSRIITAIHHYERRRRMVPETRDVFYKYLAYGGLDVAPNMFQGISERDTDSMDKDTLTRALAQTSLSHEFRDIGKESSKWVVDFEGVMKGFLSRRVPFFYALDTEANVYTVTNLLSNFMNYLLHHDVCPEYREPILAAKQCCIKASRELWSTRQAQKWLPGDFNVACSTLFGGAYSKRYDGQTSWTEEGGGFVGQTDEQARQIVKFAVACAGSEEQYQLWYEKAMVNDIKVTKARKGVGLAITEIIMPDNETRDFYKEKTKEFRPVGKIYTKGWRNPSGPVDDLTPEEQALRTKATGDTTSAAGGFHQVREAEEDEYEFFIEEAVLQHLFAGMKLEATVRTLNCGICFIDEVFNAYCSFDTFLPNDRLYGYKKPRYLRGFHEDDDGLVRYDPQEAKGREGKDDDEEVRNGD
jgi:Argonaute siRNA chaperone (ARC) complex subunit Arb1